MMYAYEDLGDEQFETFVVFLCQKLFGIAVQGFSKGPRYVRASTVLARARRHLYMP